MVTATSSTSSSTSTASTSSITTSGTSTSSSIDWNALITVAVNAKLAGATAIQTKIDANTAKITAYQGLQTNLTTLSKGLLSMATSVINPLATNVFASRAATVTSTGNVSAASALSMTVSNAAATGNHTLTIEQIAAAHKISSGSVASQNDALGYSGTFSLGLAGGTSQSITVTAGMTMRDVVDAINAQTSTTNVEASIVQVSAGSYKLVLTGTKDAADITYTSESGDDLLNAIGATDGSGAFTSVLQAAKPALFTLDGISLTRDTNDVSDVMSGITFSLLQPTPTGTSLDVNVQTDLSQISSEIASLVSNYNAFRDAVVAQQATNSDGSAATSAVLFGDSTVRSVMSSIQNLLGSTINGMTMADIGLSFNSKNELQLDTGKLSTALTTNLSGVIKFLSAQTTTSTSQLSVVNTGTAPQSFTLDVTVDADGKLSSASINGDSSLFTISGNSIIGASGTIYSGMAFNYTGSTSQSITITSTQGLATQLYQTAKNAGGTSGSLQTHVDSLLTQDTSMQAKALDIQAAAATFKAQLQAQYAKYQSAIQSANNLINYMKALLNASMNN